MQRLWPAMIGSRRLSLRRSRAGRKSAIPDDGQPDPEIRVGIGDGTEMRRASAGPLRRQAGAPTQCHRGGTGWHLTPPSKAGRNSSEAGTAFQGLADEIAAEEQKGRAGSLGTRKYDLNIRNENG